MTAFCVVYIQMSHIFFKAHFLWTTDRYENTYIYIMNELIQQIRTDMHCTQFHNHKNYASTLQNISWQRSHWICVKIVGHKNLTTKKLHWLKLERKKNWWLDHSSSEWFLAHKLKLHLTKLQVVQQFINCSPKNHWKECQDYPSQGDKT